MHRNGIPRVCFYFCSAEQNFELFSLPRNGSEWNFESLLLFSFHSTEFIAFSSSSERFRTEFREFFVPRKSRNSAGTNQLFRLFRLPRNNFFVGKKKLPTLVRDCCILPREKRLNWIRCQCFHGDLCLIFASKK